ncbi:serine/threonine protein kinase [Pseudonocardia sediminis]|uniref:Serine/threonine protein kinase n=1 Tax=Pseudonocardia sediminis TaxID=1397368 RepID=A0A4Q7UUD7_PSEST|nr:serine/threonine-protein kinase [Pseudonocardia sediminis]RZT85482.1 serine/threonine protein kinase [Pseudonocardia sediminis]
METLGPDDPTSVGRFRIRGVLGAGGMGRVLLGVDPSGTPAAIKLVHTELVDDDGFRARFRREVSLAALAPARYTAAFLDADPDAPRPWLATAHLDAPSLHDELAAHGPLPPDRAAALGTGLAEGLAALHAVGLVHRDLKPSNVLLAADGPRLIDFGISRAVDGTRLTASGQVVGTPEYMSPEQVAGAGEIGPASDVFSLGSLLCAVTTGRTPFAAGTPAGTLYRVVYTEPELGAGLGPLTGVVGAFLAKNPADRPSAAIAREWLTAAPATPTLRATAVADPRPTLVAGPRPDSPAPAPGPGPGPAATGRRRRTLLAAAAVVTAALLGSAVTVAVLGPGRDDATGDLTATTGPTSSAPVTAQATPSSTPPATAAATDPGDPAVGASVVDTAADTRFGTDALRFRSPTGNISCLIGSESGGGGDGVRCDVTERTWQVPPAPADCPLAYGTGVALAGSGAATLTCVGDTVADPSLPVLDYGRAIRRGDVVCASREDGVACRNGSTRHGFTVARTSYRLY